MLKYFRIKNFKSIVDDTIDFVFSDNLSKRVKNDKRNIVCLFGDGGNKKEGIVPVSAFFGANANGKTNIIDSIKIFKTILMERESDIKTNYYPNKLIEENKSTFFEICAILNKEEYKYSIEYNNEEIIRESFIVNNEEQFSISETSINLVNIANKKKSLFDESNLKEYYKKSCLYENKQKSCFLSKLYYNYPNFNKKITNFAKFVDEGIKIFRHENELPIFINFMSYKLYNTKNKEDLFKEIQSSFKKTNDIINDLDMDIEKISIEENKMTSKLEMFSYHKDFMGEDVKFNFLEEESLGTRELFFIVYFILFSFDLKENTVLLVDELENSLHPLLLMRVIEMFKKKDFNKNNSQLIFTTHNTDILENNILRTSEINIVRKFKKIGTKVARLDKYRDENGNKINHKNIRKKYLDGLYGGIPFPNLWGPYEL